MSHTSSVEQVVLSHQIIVPFAIQDASKVPAVDQSFSPYFTVSMLKVLVGRKGRLYIRSMKPLKEYLNMR